MKSSKIKRLATALRSGSQLTAKQIASRFNVVNPYDLVYRLRNDGFRVRSLETTNSKGETKLRYALAR